MHEAEDPVPGIAAPLVQASVAFFLVSVIVAERVDDTPLDVPVHSHVQVFLHEPKLNSVPTAVINNIFFISLFIKNDLLQIY